MEELKKKVDELQIALDEKTKDLAKLAKRIEDLESAKPEGLINSIGKDEKPKKIEIPDTAVKVEYGNGKKGKFKMKVPSLHFHDSRILTAQECLDDKAVMKWLVENTMRNNSSAFVQEVFE